MIKTDYEDIRYPVAVLDEHWMLHPQTKKPIYISEDLLKKIADNMNRRLYLTGDESPIVVGHTQDGLPESKQPKVIGFARDFHVAPFYRSGKKALFCRWRIYKDKMPLLVEYPRRSVELWLDRWEVDPISVLGATTPDRDLGPVRLAASTESTVTHVFESQMNDEVVQQVIAALQQTPEFQFLRQLMEEAQGMQGAPGGGEPAEAPQEMPAEEPQAAEEPVQHAHEDGSWTEGPEGHFGGEGSVSQPPQTYQCSDLYDEDETYRERTSPQVKKAAGPAAPSGSNTFVPGTGGMGQKKRYARDPQADASLRRLQGELDQSRQANRHLLARFARAERGRELMELATVEGIDLDLDDELNFVAPEKGDPIPEQLYRAHIDRIRKK